MLRLSKAILDYLCKLICDPFSPSSVDFTKGRIFHSRFFYFVQGKIELGY